MNNLLGSTIKEYRLQKRLGDGGFGVVYQAHQNSVGRDVAIKIIRPEFANRPDFIRRFETEAHTIGKLEHPHIVPLYDYWRDPDGAYLVMRLLPGGSLRDALEDQGPLDAVTTAVVLEQIASALRRAHTHNIIHRDIKPENILLDEDGHAYLTDFGIAKDLGIKNGPTAAEEIVGSLDYISPEQARNQPITRRTDVYSLGVVLYELLTGTHPWPDVSSVERLYKHINDPLPKIDDLDGVDVTVVNEIIQIATAKDPDRRYATPEKLAEAFKVRVVEATPESDTLEEHLTPRELDVLRGLVDAKTNKEIATDLFIQPGTVTDYTKQIYRKMRVKGRHQAARLARSLNIFDDEGARSGEGVHIKTSALANVKNPYKGLDSFSEGDAIDFFGRDALVNNLVGRVENSRFVAVVGPSGSGKSSVVKAGLIPAIWQGQIPNSESWYIIKMLPGSHPLDQLETELTRKATDPSINFMEKLSRDDRGLLRCADLILPKDEGEVLLVIDQFEEVFTMVDDEDRRQHFLDMLRVAASDPRSRVRIVVTLRADFYDRPLRYPEFGKLLKANMETVLPLSAEELEQAIVEPAKRLGIVFEPGLLATMVSEMTYQAGALPLLQFALTELFDRRDGREIRRAAYQEIGGAVGALAQGAEEIFQAMSGTGQAATRQMFLRLVTLGEGVEDTRRRTARVELLAIADEPELMDEIINELAASRLLSLDNDADTRTPTVEVAHEALLREWERLREWLNASRDDIRRERVLAAATADWMANNRDMSYLLRGSRLEQFADWIDTTNVSLTPDEREYVRASIAQRKAEVAREQQREEAEAAQERRSTMLLRALVAVFALAAVLSGGFGLFALDQQAEAETARDDAQSSAEVSRSLRLASDSQLALDRGDTDLALNLGLAAVAIDNPPARAQLALSQAAYAPGVRWQVGSFANPPSSVKFSPDEQVIAVGFGRSTGDVLYYAAPFEDNSVRLFD